MGRYFKTKFEFIAQDLPTLTTGELIELRYLIDLQLLKDSKVTGDSEDE